ncbi:hypothetical protein QQ056_00610 [Oscillatoria laete-virens NRMC-F 0139]|nr:hypothetical protein [Oscillatoria laete-virens]MDL5052077.1 hypothetical protein [Oscillatoria laete-virens NRMC-F 0139]
MESFLTRSFKWIILATLGLILALAMPVLSQPSPSSPQQLVQQGREFYQEGKFSASEQVLQAAQREYRNRGDALNQALVSNYLSLVYQQQGKWDDAKSAIASSLDLLGSTPTNTGENRVFASVLTTQGRLQLALGQSEQAFTSWQQAAKVYQNLGDKAGIQGSLINQAQALEAIGFYKRSCNTVLEVLEFKDRTCEQISEDTSLEQILQHIERQTDSQLKAVGLRSLGNLLRSLGQLDLSETALKESLEVASKLNSSQDISLAFLNLGNTQRAKAKQAEDFNESPDQIRRLYQSALVNYQDSIDNSLLPAVQLHAQLNVLSLLLKRSDSQAQLDRDLTEAQQLVVSIQSLLNQLQPSPIEVEGRINLACSILECDRLIKGQREPNLILSIEELNNLLNIALQEAEDLGDAKLKAYALGTIGKIYEYQENWQQAQAFTQAALDLSSPPELAYQWQWQIGRILKQSPEQALPFYEKAVDNLKLLRRDLISLNPDVQFNFRDQIEPVYRQYVDLLLKTENPSQKI